MLWVIMGVIGLCPQISKKSKLKNSENFGKKKFWKNFGKFFCKKFRKQNVYIERIRITYI
jgi:hypothetical protein